MGQDLTYEEWVQYCFDREVRQPEWYWDFDGEVEANWFDPEPIVLAKYLNRLFRGISGLIPVYPEDQLAQGLYFIFSIGSDYLQTARDKDIHEKYRTRWVESICYLYTDLFSSYCSHYYGHLNAGPEKEKPLNGICYMLWDLDGVEGAAMFPGEEELIEPIFHSLQCGLNQNNIACVESALHGLGHLQPNNSGRVKRIIREYLQNNKNITCEIREYAERALVGYIL